jgi:uncharacterized protein
VRLSIGPKVPVDRLMYLLGYAPERDLATRVPAPLRSPDAVHVASALAIGDAIDSLITYDKRMLDAAREAGLVAFAPGMAD